MLMQKLTIYLLAVLLFCVSMGVSAQQPEAMNVHKTTGEVTSTSLVSIEHITFAEDVLILTTSEGTFNLPLSDVDYITFGEKKIATSVENVDANSLRISLLGNTLSIESENILTALYLVDMTGKMLASEKLSSVNEASVVLPHSGAFVLFLETNAGYIARKVIMN